MQKESYLKIKRAATRHHAFRACLRLHSISPAIEGKFFFFAFCARYLPNNIVIIVPARRWIEFVCRRADDIVFRLAVALKCCK